MDLKSPELLHLHTPEELLVSFRALEAVLELDNPQDHGVNGTDRVAATGLLAEFWILFGESRYINKRNPFAVRGYAKIDVLSKAIKLEASLDNYREVYEGASDENLSGSERADINSIETSLQTMNDVLNPIKQE